MQEERYERINTYNYFWSMKTTLYSIEGYMLPIPVGSSLMFYFGILVLFTYVLNKIPIINLIYRLPYISNPIISYLCVPLVAAYFLDHIKLDGKAPYIYLFDLIKFMISPKKYDGFKPLKIEKGMKINKKLKFRKEKVINMVEKQKINKKAYRYSHEYL